MAELWAAAVSLTITEAGVVNQEATYLLSFDLGEQQHADLLDDLKPLIAKAHKTLGAGWTPQRYADAVEAWDAS